MWISIGKSVEILGIIQENSLFIGFVLLISFQHTNLHNLIYLIKICKLIPLIHKKYPQNVEIAVKE